VRLECRFNVWSLARIQLASLLYQGTKKPTFITQQCCNWKELNLSNWGHGLCQLLEQAYSLQVVDRRYKRKNLVPQQFVEQARLLLFDQFSFEVLDRTRGLRSEWEERTSEQERTRRFYLCVHTKFFSTRRKNPDLEVRDIGAPVHIHEIVVWKIMHTCERERD
jgi:hypothetical protein